MSTTDVMAGAHAFVFPGQGSQYVGMGKELAGTSSVAAAIFERADREGVPAYIEASSVRSAALYERLGFEHIEELRVGGSPPLWLMLRQPHPSG